MPIYEYVCQSCGKKTEALQRVGEKHLKICSHCGGKLKKVFSAPAIQFKGSGFYITDYARGTNAGKSGTTPKVDTESGSSESKPSEAKPSEAKSGESKSAESAKSDAKPHSKSDTKKGSRKGS